nr:MAG TPA: hypothetical protein [Caudoviricetes sp.]
MLYPTRRQVIPSTHVGGIWFWRSGIPALWGITHRGARPRGMPLTHLARIPQA